MFWKHLHPTQPSVQIFGSALRSKKFWALRYAFLTGSEAFVEPNTILPCMPWPTLIEHSPYVSGFESGGHDDASTAPYTNRAVAISPVTRIVVIAISLMTLIM